MLLQNMQELQIKTECIELFLIQESWLQERYALKATDSLILLKILILLFHV